MYSHALHKECTVAALLLVLLLGDPIAAECLQTRDCGSTDPARVKPIVRMNEGYLHVFRHHFLDTLVETVSEAVHHGRSTCRYDAVVEGLPKINITSLDC
jgi:hypothetical protein